MGAVAPSVMVAVSVCCVPVTMGPDAAGASAICAVTLTTDSAVMVTSANDESWPSVAVSRRTYEPGALNDAVVCGALALPNVTVPGPETTLQALVSVGGCGKPS